MASAKDFITTPTEAVSEMIDKRLDFFFGFMNQCDKNSFLPFLNWCDSVCYTCRQERNSSVSCLECNFMNLNFDV